MFDYIYPMLLCTDVYLPLFIVNGWLFVSTFKYMGHGT
uniref:Uncharacterized protein n=1 Tax=Arundo donax TaxID=35708 RepID=A0A0A8ZA18_ARUDO